MFSVVRNTHVGCSDTVLDELRELLLVSFLVIILELLHVVSYVFAKDVIAMDLRREVLALTVVSWETTAAVWDLETTIDSSLHSTEYSSSSAGTSQTGVKVAAEWSGLSILRLYQVVITIDVIISLIDAVQIELLQHATSKQQT